MFHQIGEVMLDLVYPRYCISCQKPGTVLCSGCLCTFDFYFLPVRLQLEPNYIDQYLVAARLEGIVRKMVHQLKYAGVKELAKVAGEILYQCTEWPDADCVTSVPLHPVRYGERGYNQAEVMARSFAVSARMPYLELLKRTANTPHQAQQQTREDRAENIEDYFALRSELAAQKTLVGTHIILIDDVCTTGITLNHCAKVLKSAGCSTITALTLAHGK